jgi:hypothetical protein
MADLQGTGSHFITFSYLISTLSVASERPPVRWQPHISNLKGRTADSDGGTSGIINKSSISSAAGGKGAKVRSPLRQRH